MATINSNTLSKQSPLRSGSYKTSTKHFFRSSKLFEAQITETFDHLWPTITALKNLRWQVNGYYHCMETRDNVELTKKFVENRDITVRPNLYRMCIELPWEEQEFHVAQNLLIQLFACYEAWCESILKEAHCNNIRDNAKKLQFPIRCGSCISALSTAPNTSIVNAFYNTYINSINDASVANIDNYLLVYRYFKEIRNNIAHTGGIIDAKVMTAYQDIARLSNNDIDVTEFPEHFTPILGAPIKISLRGIVGFAQILLKLVTVIDVELIKSNNADKYYIDAIRASMTCRIFDAPGRGKNEIFAAKLSKQSYFKKPSPGNTLYQLLQSNQIVR